MKYKAQISEDEQALLEEIERFAQWALKNERYMTIFLTEKQYKLFTRLCGRLKEHSLLDRFSYVRHIDTNLLSYRGFKISTEKPRKRYTKKDLMDLPI